MDKRQDDTV